jgi:hypothetical protein
MLDPFLFILIFIYFLSCFQQVIHVWERWVLSIECWVLSVECQVLSVKCSALSIESWVLNVKHSNVERQVSSVPTLSVDAFGVPCCHYGPLNLLINIAPRESYLSSVSDIKCWGSSIEMMGKVMEQWWVHKVAVLAASSIKHSGIECQGLQCISVGGIKHQEGGQGDGTVMNLQGCSVSGMIKRWASRVNIQVSTVEWGDRTVTSEFARLQMSHQC